MVAIAAVLLLGCSLVAAQFITTCHNDGECGTVCGSNGPDTVGTTEGIFGTNCWCDGGGLSNRCTYNGHNIQVCANYKPPKCSTACGQKVCITKNGRHTTGVIRTACPAHHPQNTGDCCAHKNDDYCTCIIRMTMDLNWKPYSELGNQNGWAQSVKVGACNSQLASLGIEITSERATKLVQPFLVNGEEQCASTHRPELLGYEARCEQYTSAESCHSHTGCTYCTASQQSGVATQCYAMGEAAVLTHTLTTEQGADAFTCTRPATPAVFHPSWVNCTIAGPPTA